MSAIPGKLHLQMAGIYIHIPFCSKACHYCDFHFSTNQNFVEDILKAIGLELALQRKYLDDEAVTTVYFGGGTPSLLDVSLILNLFKIIKNNFRVESDLEFTLEANPEDLTIEKLLQLKEVGINRLSIGVQSFDDNILKFLNRSHSGSQALKSIENARKVGFSNLSVDLIYAIPNQSSQKLNNDLNQLIDLKPQHISAYSLTIEEKTVFGKWASAKKLFPVDDDVNANHFEVVHHNLIKHGYQHYEISNYSLPGFESRHNSGYWKQQKYLGVGPSAHSFNGQSRQSNVYNNSFYVKAIQEGKVPATVEILRRNDHINEYIMTSLRTMWGCNLNHLKENYQFDLLAFHPKQIQLGLDNGLFQLQNSVLTLTQKGKMHADKLSSDLFLIN